MKAKKVAIARLIPELAPDKQVLSDMVTEFRVAGGLASVGGWAEFSKTHEYAKFVKGHRGGKDLVDMLWKAYKAGWESGVVFSFDFFKEQILKEAVKEK